MLLHQCLQLKFQLLSTSRVFSKISVRLYGYFVCHHAGHLRLRENHRAKLVYKNKKYLRGCVLTLKFLETVVLFQIPYKIRRRIYVQSESKPFWLDQSAYPLGHIYFIRLKGEVQWRGEQAWGIVSGSEHSDGGVKSFRVTIHKTSHTKPFVKKLVYCVKYNSNNNVKKLKMSCTHMLLTIEHRK